MTDTPFITPASLTAMGAHNPATNAPWLAQAANRWLVVGLIPQAMWLTMLHHESGGFVATAENLNYSTAQRIHQAFPRFFPTDAAAASYAHQPVMLGNKVYGLQPNGTNLGGYDFRGRGWPQLTGRDNYARYAIAVGKPISQVGAWMETPEGAADVGGWYWHQAGCSAFADAGDLLSVRDAWAGRPAHTANPFGWTEVLALYPRVLAALRGNGAVQVHAGSGAAQQVAGQDEADLLDATMNPEVSV